MENYRACGTLNRVFRQMRAAAGAGRGFGGWQPGVACGMLRVVSKRSGPVTPAGGPRSRSARDPHLSRLEIIVRLAAAPRRIAAATAGVPNSRLRAAPAPDAWSIVDILAHLRASADVWGGAIDQILAARCPTFKAISPHTWLKQTDYRSLDFAVLLRAYTRQRTALVRQLLALPARAWERSAIVTGCGAALERTLTWYALGIAGHEHSHLKHIERLMNEGG